MSTIPITFDERKIHYTVLGGMRPGTGFPSSALPFTVVLLSRGDRFLRQNAIKDLVKLGFHDIVCMEEPNIALETDGIVQNFPSVRFLVPGESLSRGEAVNLGLKESGSDAVLVMGSDMKISQAGVSIRFFDRFLEEGCLAWAPSTFLPDGSGLPCAVVPAFARRNMKFLQLPNESDSVKTLFPFDFAGVYNREKFVMLGGFDHTIKNPWWQLADFGFRSVLWGERIAITHSLKMTYLDAPESADTTFDSSYKRFWLKNIAPDFSGDSSRIKLRAFPEYWLRSGSGPFEAFRELQEARAWIRVNKYRFKTDSRAIIELWGNSPS